MKDENVLFSKLRTKKHYKLVSVAGTKMGDSWVERKERKYVASASTIFFQMKDSGQAILFESFRKFGVCFKWYNRSEKVIKWLAQKLFITNVHQANWTENNSK